MSLSSSSQFGRGWDSKYWMGGSKSAASSPPHFIPTSPKLTISLSWSFFASLQVVVVSSKRVTLLLRLSFITDFLMRPLGYFPLLCRVLPNIGRDQKCILALSKLTDASPIWHRTMTYNPRAGSRILEFNYVCKVLLQARWPGLLKESVLLFPFLYRM